eukprot:5753125-Pyramimonas_sp.AAC.1
MICAGYAETDKAARGVYRRSWPGDIKWSDVRNVSRREFEDLRRACPGAAATVGARCPPRQGVSGPGPQGSGLEVPRLQAELGGR